MFDLEFVSKSLQLAGAISVMIALYSGLPILVLYRKDRLKKIKFRAINISINRVIIGFFGLIGVSGLFSLPRLADGAVLLAGDMPRFLPIIDIPAQIIWIFVIYWFLSLIKATTCAWKASYGEETTCPSKSNLDVKFSETLYIEDYFDWLTMWRMILVSMLTAGLITHIGM